MTNAAQQITTDASYDADLEIATELMTASYDVSGSPEGEAEKAIGDRLNNSWVEGITIAEWVERAAADAREYLLIQSTASGERYVLHRASATCGGPLSSSEADELAAGVGSLASCATDDDADSWMLDSSSVRVLRTERVGA